MGEYQEKLLGKRLMELLENLLRMYGWVSGKKSSVEYLEDRRFLDITSAICLEISQVILLGMPSITILLGNRLRNLFENFVGHSFENF